MAENPDPRQLEEKMVDLLINIVAEAEHDTDWGGCPTCQIPPRLVKQAEDLLNEWSKKEGLDGR